MTPVDTVRKENVWHPLKTMKFNPSFKPIIYANDPELKEMADGPNQNVFTIIRGASSSISLKKKAQGIVPDVIDIPNPI